MSPPGIVALLLAALAAFAWLSARKLRIVAALQPESRWDHPGDRLRTLVTNGLLQQRMIRHDWRPGLMHAIIFLGFVSLLVRKLQLVIIGFDREFALAEAALEFAVHCLQPDGAFLVKVFHGEEFEAFVRRMRRQMGGFAAHRPGAGHALRCRPVAARRPRAVR